jgi:SAM-dependent methyltransferase
MLTKNLNVLDVAPWRGLSDCYRTRPNVSYIGLDLVAHGPHVTVVGDITSLPIKSHSTDAIICIHVLEHIHDDRTAMAELCRVLKPGGWAIIAVPIRLDEVTYEDFSIVDPEERKIAFGELNHVRYYGIDIVDRLQTAGFSVQIDRGADLADEVCRKFGLRKSETILHCYKD